MSQHERRIRRIAISCAVAALLTAAAAVVVVAVRRTDRPREPVAATRHVAAHDVMKLEPAAVTQAGDGVQVSDAVLGTALGLARGDTLVAISGHRVTRPDELPAILRELVALAPRSLFVDLVRDREPVFERWELDGELAAVPPGRLIATVRRLSGTMYLVPRATVEAWTAHPVAVTSGGSVAAVPGEGFRIYAIQQGSAFAALGLQSGDLVRAINGSELGSADRILDIIALSTTQVSVDVTRDGRPIILNYLIR